eukprot:6091881-Pleurochrysis_carterae.AAC.2
MHADRCLAKPPSFTVESGPFLCTTCSTHCMGKHLWRSGQVVTLAQTSISVHTLLRISACALMNIATDNGKHSEALTAMSTKIDSHGLTRTKKAGMQI